MAYLVKRPRRRRARGLGDWFSDLFGGGGSTPDPNAPSTPGGDIGTPETPGTSSSSTTSDTTMTPSGATVGGQDVGVPSTSSWKSVGGVCYATTSDFLASLKTLQRQLNRVATAKGIALIAVDGSVGPLTLALMNTVAGYGAYKAMANPDTSTCDAVCTSAFAFIAATQAFADSLGAPDSVASPSGSPQVWNNATGTLVKQPIAADLADTWGNLSSTNKMIVGAAAVGLGYWALKQGKAARRRSSSVRTRSYR